MTVTQSFTDTFWTTPGNWDTSVWSAADWDTADDRLPILKNMPAGTQTGDGGLHLMRKTLANVTVTDTGPYPYTGSSIKPTLTVKFGTTELVKDIMPPGVHGSGHANCL